MPNTFQAVLVAALAILPGALYTWTFEQQAGRWGATADDRIERFLGVSTVFLGLTSYAAGYPEIQDLLIADLAEMDPAGELLVDAQGHPILRGVALRVRDEVAHAK